MKTYLLLAGLVFISKYDKVFSDDDDSEEKFERESLASELINLLNGTYFNLNANVCQLQRKVDAIKQITDTDNQCECNETEMIEFKGSISSELEGFSKTLSGFENQMRLLKKEQSELRELMGGGDSEDDRSSPTTTTSAPPVCDQGWISSPEKCYYVSTRSEKTEWSNVTSRCTAKGAKLAEIKTDEEAEFLLQSMPSRIQKGDIIYTGRKRNDADDWVFVSNDELVDMSVRSWGPGEPHGGNSRCGCIWKAQFFLMLDCYCTGYSLFYMCEIAR